MLHPDATVATPLGVAWYIPARHGAFMALLSRSPAANPRPAALARWLLLIAAIVFAIIVVGGITRLTESGLSITEWKPIRGVIPPLNHADWMAEFENYKRIPQYEQFNRGMTLAGFQQIYFWEYLHRLLARAVGLVTAGVALAFWWKRWIPAGYGGRLILILALGGLQGVIGWWMVYSGLSVRTEVSHVRLAVHLIAALLIFSYLIWTALNLMGAGAAARLTGLGVAALAVLTGQLVLGAFTAGLRAGHAFSSWPKMGDEWFPAATPMLSPAWINIVDNPIVVQFVHRWWAFAVVAILLLMAARLRRDGAGGRALLLLLIVAVQILLGIATLLSGVALWIAVLHQAVAASLVAATVAGAHRIGRA